MERRTFLRTLIGGVAAAAAVRTFPFRVFSFPSRPVIAPDTARRILAVINDANQFIEGDIVFFLNPDQKKAWDRLAYKITKIDQRERTIELADIHQSQYNWKNLSRSPKPFRVGVT